MLEEAGVVLRTVEGSTHRLGLGLDALGEAADWIDRQRAVWERMLCSSSTPWRRAWVIRRSARILGLTWAFARFSRANSETPASDRVRAHLLSGVGERS